MFSILSMVTPEIVFRTLAYVAIWVTVRLLSRYGPSFGGTNANDNNNDPENGQFVDLENNNNLDCFHESPPPQTNDRRFGWRHVVTVYKLCYKLALSSSYLLAMGGYSTTVMAAFITYIFDIKFAGQIVGIIWQLIIEHSILYLLVPCLYYWAFGRCLAIRLYIFQQTRPHLYGWLDSGLDAMNYVLFIGTNIGFVSWAICNVLLVDTYQGYSFCHNESSLRK